MGRDGRPHLEDRREDLRWDRDARGPGRNWETIAKEHIPGSWLNYYTTRLNVRTQKVNQA